VGSKESVTSYPLFLLFEMRCYSMIEDAKLAKIRGFELFNEANWAVMTFTLLVGTSLLLMVLI